MLPFSNQAFEWNDKIDDDEFENLILELLNREPGVERVRKMGKGREPDEGRDLMVEWYLPNMPQNTNKEHPLERKRVVVQCKAYKKSVDKSQVTDLVDLLYLHRARGYLLVTSSRPTNPVIRYLETLEERNGYWTDWWTRIEIEDRLRANRDVALRYSHIVKTVEGDRPSP